MWLWGFFSYRYRWTWSKGGKSSGTTGYLSKRTCRQDSAQIFRSMGNPQYFKYRVHKNNRGETQKGRPVHFSKSIWKRRHLPRSLRRLVLRSMRDILHRNTTERWSMPRLPETHWKTQRGELLLQTIQVWGAASQASWREQRLHFARCSLQRGCELFEKWFKRFKREPDKL